MSEVAEKKVKKAAAVAVKKPNHPRTAEMVDAAIGTLKERGGSSILAIKKYVAATYKVDVEKLAPYIKKYVKGAVIKGHLLQTKGKGASGSFKLSVQPKKTAAPKPKKVVVKKQPAAGEPEKEKKKEKTLTAAKKKEDQIKVKVSGTKKSGTIVKKKAMPKKVTAPTKAAAPKTKVQKQPPTKKVSVKK